MKGMNKTEMLSNYQRCIGKTFCGGKKPQVIMLHCIRFLSYIKI